MYRSFAMINLKQKQTDQGNPEVGVASVKVQEHNHSWSQSVTVDHSYKFDIKTGKLDFCLDGLNSGAEGLNLSQWWLTCSITFLTKSGIIGI